MSARPRSLLSTSPKTEPSDKSDERMGDKESISGARIVGESIVVFIVSYIVLYAIGYFFAPDYLVKGGAQYSSYVGTVYTGMGVLALIIALIYAAVRSKRRG